MSIRNAPPEYPFLSTSVEDLSEVDRYGVPLGVFGGLTPPGFFDVVGRIVAINGTIEYLRDRIGHLPQSETEDVKKVNQFLKRDDNGRIERNAIVHSRWIFGADPTDPEVILGVRYKVRKLATGETAVVAIRDVADSEKVQEIVRYKLDVLRKVLKRDLVTLQVGELAYSDVMFRWAARQGPSLVKP
jgi:hypothetical protein